MANNGGFWLQEISIPIRQADGTPWRVHKPQKAKSATIKTGLSASFHSCRLQTWNEHFKLCTSGAGFTSKR